MWSVREAVGGAFVGLTGFMRRPDGRGMALRFAFWPEAQGRGLAREAAGAALRFGHDRAGLERIVAVARETNFASRTVLGGIGMREAGGFVQGGHAMVLYESVRRPCVIGLCRGRSSVRLSSRLPIWASRIEFVTTVAASNGGMADDGQKSADPIRRYASLER